MLRHKVNKNICLLCEGIFPKNIGMIISLGKGERRDIIKVFIFSNSVYLWNFINNQKLFCRTYYSFLWCLLGGHLYQDETEYHLPRQQLLEIHWSRLLMQNFKVLWKTHGNRSSCWYSGWRVEGLRGWNPWWEWQTRFSHKMPPDPCQSLPTVE